MQDITVALVQSDLVWENMDANLERFGKLLDHVPTATDLVILPEMFSTGFSIKSDVNAQTMEGQTLRWMKQKASRLNMVVTGSILTKAGNEIFNRLFWVQPDGDVKKYDKRHLFRFAGEHKILSGGTEKLIVRLKGWKIQPLICYDLRFPVWSKNRFQNGTYDFDLLLYVANWPEARNYAWKNLLIARAIENQAFCVGVNRVGTDEYGNLHSGDSMIIDPKGKILAKGEPFNQEIITTTLHYDYLLQSRKEFPVGLDWDDFEMKNL